MTKKAKRLEKLRQNPRHVSVNDLDAILIDQGFVRREGKGSHTVYQHPALNAPLVIAAHGKHVPTYIVKQVLAAIDKLNTQEEFDEDRDETE